MVSNYSLTTYCFKVLRVTSTQALAKAAAIKSHSKAGLKGTSWIRSPRTTIALIGIIWMISLVFVVLPLAKHCEDGIVQCTNDTTKEYFVIRNNSFTTDPGKSKLTLSDKELSFYVY